MRSRLLLLPIVLLLLGLPVRMAADAAAVPATTLHDQLLRAVKERRVVSFNYDGRRRVVEPHAYGESRKGNGLLRGFELPESDGAPSAGAGGWTLFSTDKITAVEISDRSFPEPRPGYRRGDRKMSRIHAEL